MYSKADFTEGFPPPFHTSHPGEGEELCCRLEVVRPQPRPTCRRQDWMRGRPKLASEMRKPYAGAIDVWEVGLLG